MARQTPGNRTKRKGAVKAGATRPSERAAPAYAFEGEFKASKLDAFDGVRAIGCAGERLEEMRGVAQQFRKWFKEQGRVHAIRTRNVTAFPFPVNYGLYGVPTLPYPYFLMRHRMNIVQFRRAGKLKILLVNATDPERSSQAPYFKRLRDATPERVQRYLFEHVVKSPLQLVREAGLRPEDIDYITHDHMHTQDLRGVLGTTAGADGSPALEPEFPNATVIVQRAELESLKRLHPLQRPWFVADAVKDVRPEKLLALDGDYLLGEGVAILHTPGHTNGNQTILLNTDRGVFGVSENGVCPDAYTPECSRIPGVKRYLKLWGREVILNGNTLEGSMDQYTSMVQEKNVVDFNDENPNFVNMHQSSPLEHSPLNPGIKPSFTIRPLNVGRLEIPGA